MGAVRAAEVIDVFPSHLAEVVRLKLTYTEDAPSDAPATLIAKLSEGEAFDSDGLAEIRFFNRIAPGVADLPAPAFYGSLVDPDARACVLLVEDLEANGYRRAAPDLSQADLDAVIDRLADLHAQLWNAEWPTPAAFARPRESLTRCTQAWPPEVIRANADFMGPRIAAFANVHRDALTTDDLALLADLAAHWGEEFTTRVQGRRNLTLIHGDFHVLGNIFLASDGRAPRFIDWSEAKPGLGPHDLAYVLVSIPADDPAARNRRAIQRYHDRLTRLGVAGYDAGQCAADYAFSLRTNLLQAVLQDSVTWFRRTADAVRALAAG
jgi:hypothetical protein